MAPCLGVDTLVYLRAVGCCAVLEQARVRLDVHREDGVDKVVVLGAFEEALNQRDCKWGRACAFVAHADQWEPVIG